MKIAVNGSIIETEDIYEITPIVSDNDGHIDHQFQINFLNNNVKKFAIRSGCYISTHGIGTYTKIDGVGEDSFDSERTLEDLINSDQYKATHKKLSDFRDSIVKIWSENQSKIPQFNYEYD